MIEVPISIVGPTGGSRSTQFSSELTLNMYMDISDAANRKGAHDFPGQKLFSDGAGADRGSWIMGTGFYVLNGFFLQRVLPNGDRTTLALISGNNRAVFADDGTNLYIVTNGNIYRWNGSALSTISQSVVNSPSSIAYINRQFIITGENGLFGTSDVADGTTYNALNYAEAESNPDSLLRAYVFSQMTYLLGSKSTETWYNSGDGNPPFNRQDSSLMNIGLAGRFAVTNTDAYLYWLSDDRKVYQCVGASARSVSTGPVANMLEGFGDVSDCIASSFVLQGQDFVLFSFPSANKTLLYSETLEYWVELASSSYYPGDRWYGNAVMQCYGKNLSVDHRNGNVYELDLDTHTDNGDTRIRIRTLPSFTGALIGKPGKRITVGGVRIGMQVGVGIASGQGVNPVVMCEFSNDGGHTYGTESHVEIGAMGDYTQTVSFDDFATGYDVRCRIKCTDPVYFSLFDAVVKLREAGY